MSSRHWIGLAAVLTITTSLYVARLDFSPVYLGGDEAQFAVGGHALARNGRNVDGAAFPLFFNLRDPLGDPIPMPWGDTWYHPYLFYLIAIALKLAPLSEQAVRLPNALIGGLVTPFLAFAAACRFRFGYAGGIAAAIVMALTPPHFMLSREALDYTLMIPFALAWCYCLADYMETRRVRTALLSGIVLGCGCFSYIAAWGAMPMLLGISWLVYVACDRQSWLKSVAASTVGFLPAPALLMIWLAYHPTVLHETSERYRILETNRPPADQLQMADLHAVPRLYVGYFGKKFLFENGGDNVTASTGMIGVFEKPLAIFIPIGIVALWRGSRRVVLAALLLALMSAPLPAAMSGHADAVQRALLMIPFAALLGAAGVGALWRSGRWPFQVTTLLLAAATSLYFFHFLQDYYGAHRNRSAFYFDSAQFAGIAEHIVSIDRVPAVVMRRNLDAAPARWRFYLTKLHHEELLPRTRYFTDFAEVASAPVETRMVMYVESAAIASLTASGDWEIERIIKDVDGREAAAILRKVR